MRRFGPVLVIVAVMASACSGGSTHAASSAPASWGSPPGSVTVRNVRAAGLTLAPLTSPAEAHAHLALFVNGASIVIPAGIGIDVAAGTGTAIRTHDESGIIHLSASGVTLGDLFAEWGHALTLHCVGGVCAPPGQVVHAVVNAVELQGDPRSITLHNHDDVVVYVGAAPSPFPPPFAFHTYGL